MGAYYNLYLGAKQKTHGGIRIIGPYYLNTERIFMPMPILTRSRSEFPYELKNMGEKIAEGLLGYSEKKLLGYIDYAGDWNSYSSWIELNDFFYYNTEGEDIVKQGYIDEDRSMEFYHNKNNPEYIHFNLPEVYPPEYVAAHPLGDFVHIAYRDEADRSTIYYLVSSYLKAFDWVSDQYDPEKETLGIIMRVC